MNNRSYREDNEPNWKQEPTSMTNHCIYCGLEIPDDRFVHFVWTREKPTWISKT